MLRLRLRRRADAPEEVGDEDILRLGVELEQELDQLDVELLRVAWYEFGLGVRVRIGVGLGFVLRVRGSGSGSG